MRRHFAIFALLLGCLFMLQSSLAVAAMYQGCCLEDCKGPGQCPDLSCQSCQPAAALPAVPAGPILVPVLVELEAPWGTAPEGALDDVWRPPDMKRSPH